MKRHQARGSIHLPEFACLLSQRKESSLCQLVVVHDPKDNNRRAHLLMSWGGLSPQWCWTDLNTCWTDEIILTFILPISLKHTHPHRFCRKINYRKMQHEREGWATLLIEPSQIIHVAAWPDAQVHNQRKCLLCRALETGQLLASQRGRGKNLTSVLIKALLAAQGRIKNLQGCGSPN